jgi:hypothetical protein
VNPAAVQICTMPQRIPFSTACSRLCTLSDPPARPPRLPATGFAALGRNRIPERQDHGVELGMELSGFTRQIEFVAALQEIGADQQFVGIVGFRRQIAESGLLFGDGAGDARRPTEAPAQGTKQKRPFASTATRPWISIHSRPSSWVPLSAVARKGVRSMRRSCPRLGREVGHP